jgi:hemin uptake protein HemP
VTTDGVRPDPPSPSLDAAASQASDARVERVESARLLGRARELVILHAGREYRLRVTQNGKLILTA